MAAPRHARPSITARLIVAALAGLVGLVATVHTADVALLRHLELATLDWRFRWRGPIEPSGQVALVVIDDTSVARLGRWPVPRQALARAVRELHAAGARVVGLDLLLTEEERPLSGPLLEVLRAARDALPPEATAARAEIDRVLDEARADLELAVAISSSGNVVTPYAFVFDPGDANIGGVPPWVRGTAYAAWTAEAGEDVPVPEAAGLLVPASGLAATGASVGHVTLQVDVDGTVRADLPAFPFAGQLLPSLPVEMARLFLGLPREALVVHLGQRVVLGHLDVPVDAATRLLVNHYGPVGTIPTFNLAGLLAGEVAASELRGRAVILGATATGAGDRFVTPYARRLPGAEHLATAVDNILTGRALIRDREVRGADAVAALVLAALAAFLVGRSGYLRSLVATLVLASGWTALALAAFVGWNLWLGVAGPVGTILLAAGAVEGLRVAAEQRVRRRVERQRANLSRYFPPFVVDRLASSDRPSGLERTQEATVMFVDMVGSTRLFEGIQPAAAMDLLRAFHTRVERAVFAHGGMVDKYMGDGALCCFGVPDPTGRECAEALRAARDFLADLARWNAERRARGEPPIEAAAGIHHGPVLMGDIGGRTFFQFTVIGDTVNVASRLESATRQHGTPLIVSDEVVRRARAVEPGSVEDLVPVPPIAVRGRHQPVAVWTLPAVAEAAAQ